MQLAVTKSMQCTKITNESIIRHNNELGLWLEQNCTCLFQAHLEHETYKSNVLVAYMYTCAVFKCQRCQESSMFQMHCCNVEYLYKIRQECQAVNEPEVQVGFELEWVPWKPGHRPVKSKCNTIVLHSKPLITEPARACAGFGEK